MIKFLRLHVLALARFEIGREVAGGGRLELRAQAVDQDRPLGGGVVVGRSTRMKRVSMRTGRKRNGIPSG